MRSRIAVALGPRAFRAMLAAFLVTICLLAPRAVAARNLDIEDLLRRESFGQVAIAAGERWLLVEQRLAFDQGSRFDMDRFNLLFRTRIMIADLAHSSPLRPLFAPEPGVGYQLGPIAPDGAHVAVFRLKADVWELGIAALATGEVRWLGIAPEIPDYGRGVQWVNADSLVAIAMPPGLLPYALRSARPQALAPARWSATARGEASVSVIGSGRFSAERPHDPPKRILRISLADGSVETLASGDFADIELSGDGKLLAVIEAAEDIPLVAGRPPQGAFGLAVRRMRLRILDLSSGSIRTPCPACDIMATLLSWSPVRDELLVYARSDGEPWTNGHLIQVSGGGGKAIQVDDGLAASVSGRPERVAAGWWGSEPLLLGRLPGGARDDWFRLGASHPVRLSAGLERPARDGLAFSDTAMIAAADGSAWRIDRTGAAKRLSNLPFSLVARRADWIPDRMYFALGDKRQLAGVLGQGADARAIRIDPDGRLPLSLPTKGGAVFGIGTRGAAIDHIVGGGAETLLWRQAGRADLILARINPHLADVEHPEPVPIAHLGPNGEPLRSWLFLPPRAPNSPPPPLIVVPYPGTNYREPPIQIWNEVPTAPAATLIGHGYAVLLPSLPSRRDGGGPADRLAEQLLSIVEAAAAQSDLSGRFDPSRLGLWGHSFGGFATLAIIGQTNRFRAAIASAAPSDFISFHGAFDAGRRAYPEEGVSTPWVTGWVESLQADMRAPPWDDPDRYLRNSPLMKAGSIRTPVMIVVGENDGPHPGQAEEMFSALFRQNKDALLVTYSGEPHILGSPGNLRDLYARAFKFLDDAFSSARR